MSWKMTMLRTNNDFLSYIEDIYSKQTTDDILLIDYPKGANLFQQGEKHHRLGIIKNGFIKCFYSEDNGKDFIFEFLGSGEIIGEIEAIKQIECLCNIEAITDTQIYSFSASYFKLLLEKSPQLKDMLLYALAERLINTSYKASFQQAYSTKYSLQKLLNMLEKQNIKLSKSDMACYLGIDIRSLNRILKESSE